jgi:hypothetical protein
VRGFERVVEKRLGLPKFERLIARVPLGGHLVIFVTEYSGVSVCPESDRVCKRGQRRIQSNFADSPPMNLWRMKCLVPGDQ